MSASDSYLQSLYTAAGARSTRKHGLVTRVRLRSAITIAEIIADFAACTAATWAACASHAHILRDLHAYRSRSLCAGMVCGLFVVLLSLRERTYGGSGGLLQIRETERVLRVSTLSVLLLMAVNICLKLDIPGVSILPAFGLLPLSLLLEKRIFVSALRFLYQRNIGVKRAVVYGDLDASRQVASTLQQSPRLALRPVSVVAGAEAMDIATTLPMFGYRGIGTIPLQRGPLSSLLLQYLRCDLLIVVLSHVSQGELQELTVVAKEAKCAIALLSVLPEFATCTAASIDIDGMVVVPLADEPERWAYRAAKRLVDVILSGLLLAILTPLMLVIAASICLNSKGPAFFMQDRVGRNGGIFKILKFRSMYTSAPRYERSPATASDPRITKIGRILRRTSLDELPQLINVLMGDMSLVGPRPEMPFVVEEHSQQSRQRVKVLPGITGLWQLSADRVFPIHENIQYDLYYIRNRNIFMDIAILFHTLFFAVGGGI